MTIVNDEPKAIVETRLMHGVHRRGASLLADAATRPSVPAESLDELRSFLVGTLRHHHGTEDTQLWPMITTNAPPLAKPLSDLTREHVRLDAALDALDDVAIGDGSDRVALRDAAHALCEMVHAHLEHEEPILFPALRTQVTEEQWDEFSQDVIATAPTEGADLMIGLLDQVGAPDEVDLVLAGLPEPARALVPTMRAHAGSVLANLQATHPA